MSPELTLALIALGCAAGGVGALAGIGGGIIITPLLAIYFGLPLDQAIGTSLLAVIATSSATSAVYLQKHLTDLRLGMSLELASTIGAAAAAVAAGYLSRRAVAVLFIVFLLYSAANLLKRAWALTRKLAPSGQTSANSASATAPPDYQPRRYPVGLAASFVAGILSGLLGIGGGPVKVPVMYLWMGVPLQVATATSNLMIGVTAAASAYIYYGRGDIPVATAAPLVTGVFLGSILGARISPRVRPVYILLLLAGVTLFLATQMSVKVYSGIF
ncbi:MAG: sulfite exporter TauE/SafE family protein [Acidobacteria bacterium]|nr:sulfite exporter TauE/SafE family protein [Acidobacteriota bacterium]